MINELTGAVGYYEKRKCPGNRFECKGTAVFLRIENGTAIFLFIPEDKSLRPGEAIQVSE